MPEDTHENCGIAGAYFYNESMNAAPVLYKMLLHLQHRGQLSAGISTFSGKRSDLIMTYKDLGTVNEVFLTKNKQDTKEIFESCSGRAGIGHVRYATFGLPDKSHAHPFERKHGRKCKWFTFAFNGNIANFDELKRELLDHTGYHMVHNSDSEIMLHYISKELTSFDDSCNRLPDLVKAFSNLSRKFDGAYSIAFMDAEGRLAVVRDPLGLRPVCYSIDSEKVLFASEDVALFNLGCRDIRYLGAGEMLIIEDCRSRIERYAPASRKAECMFERVYFMNAASSHEGKSVYETRIALGREMAKLETLDVNPEDYVVVSVPDSSKPYGEGYAYALRLPHREGLVRNRFVGRTFIEASDRQEKIENKFSIIRDVTRGKKVLLLDDSVVRGNTSRSLVSYLREKGGAKEIHVRSSCPAIVCPCFYGIDMSTVTELIAARYVNNPGEDIDEESCRRIAREIGADTLIYQKLENIPRSLGQDRRDLCMACLTSDYPTPHGRILYQRALANHRNNVISRTYEPELIKEKII